MCKYNLLDFASNNFFEVIQCFYPFKVTQYLQLGKKRSSLKPTFLSLSNTLRLILIVFQSMLTIFILRCINS